MKKTNQKLATNKNPVVRDKKNKIISILIFSDKIQIVTEDNLERLKKLIREFFKKEAKIQLLLPKPSYILKNPKNSKRGKGVNSEATKVFIFNEGYLFIKIKYPYILKNKVLKRYKLPLKAIEALLVQLEVSKIRDCKREIVNKYEKKEDTLLKKPEKVDELDFYEKKGIFGSKKAKEFIYD